MNKLYPMRILAILLLLAILPGGFSPSRASAFTPQPSGHAGPPKPMRWETEPAAKVEIQVGSAADLDQLRALGFACEQVGACALGVTRTELKTLQKAGFEPQVLAQAIVARPAEEIQASTDDSIYGANLNDIAIPDYDGGVYCGFAYSEIDISGAPAGAVVTQVEYRLRITHSYVTDLWVFLSSDQGTSIEIWDGRDQGSATGSDGGDDDDPEDDYDIEFEHRLIDSGFDGEPVNQPWYLDANDCVVGDTGTIRRFEVWIYYLSDVDIRVQPGSLAYTHSLDGSGSADMPAFPLAAVEVSQAQRLASHTRLAQLLETQEKVRVIVHLGEPLPLSAPSALRQAAIQHEQDQVLAGLSSAEFELARRFSLTSGFAGWVTRAGLEQLIQDPQVELVYEDQRVQTTLNQSVPLINADDVHTMGITGEGVTVAVIDTGIDTDHPDLSDDLVGQHCFTDNACPPGGSNEGTSAEDGEGHGTSVSGIISSRGTVAPLGVAPDAHLVAVKVLDDSGSGWVSDWVEGINWVVANRATYGISIINMSLGTNSLYSGVCDATFPDAANAVNAAVANGITVFAASGNSASITQIAAPSCLSNSVAVGAVYDADLGPISFSNCSDLTTAADKVTCFSNSNSLVDLLAPSNRNRTTGLGGGVETNFGGTSAASPHAAAAAALLLEAVPGLSPVQVESRLEDSGKAITDHRNTLVFPRIDPLAAIQNDGFTIFNDGAGNLNIQSIASLGGSCWLDITPPQATPFSIPSSSSVYVEVDTVLCVNPGSYNDTIRITSNDPDEATVDIPVTFEFSGVPVMVSPTSGLWTSEIGSSDTFSVTLGAQPSASVTIALNSTDAGEGTVSPPSITFQTGDWDVPRWVTVTGVNDGVIDFNVPYSVTLGAASSADPVFNGWDPEDVAVVNQDDDDLEVYLPITMK